VLTLFLIRRGTLCDPAFPSANLQLLTKAELIEIIQTSDRQHEKGTCKRRWHPDGIIGYTEAVASKLGDLEGLRLTEDVFLGLAAIEHKKLKGDHSDMYACCLSRAWHWNRTSHKALPHVAIC
jgi:hypothetical protein